MNWFKAFHFARFSLDYPDTILSWVQGEKDRVLWSGNSFFGGLNHQRFKDHLRRKDLFAFQLLDSEKNIHAYGEVVLQAIDRASLCRIMVDPQIRGKGVGKYFCQKLIMEIKAWGVIREISLNTLTSNNPALRCYKRLGFRQESISKKSRKIGNTWHDLVFMSLPL